MAKYAMPNTAIIFANRKTEVANLHRSLLRHNFKAVALHGDLDQRARMAALDAFKTGDANILVASDVAARGLDIPDVSHVFNYDVPFHADDYVHRIGRTARAAAEGTAITFISVKEQRKFAAIERLLGKAVPKSIVPEQFGEAPDYNPGASRPTSGNRNTKRPQKFSGRISR